MCLYSFDGAFAHVFHQLLLIMILFNWKKMQINEMNRRMVAARPKVLNKLINQIFKKNSVLFFSESIFVD